MARTSTAFCGTGLSGLYVTLAVILAVAVAPLASGAPVEFEVTGEVDYVSASSNVLADGYDDFLAVDASPEFVASYPIGTPISMTYMVDTDWPVPLGGDSTIDYTAAIESGTVTVGTEFYEFAGGTIDLLVEPRDEGLYSSLRFDVRYDPPASEGTPIELIWVLYGTDIYQDGALSWPPDIAVQPFGTLSFSVNVAHDDYMEFSVTGARVVPEPSTWALAMCLAAVGLLVRRVAAC